MESILKEKWESAGEWNNRVFYSIGEFEVYEHNGEYFVSGDLFEDIGFEEHDDILTKEDLILLTKYATKITNAKKRFKRK